jgi:hypothetical protein
MSLIKIHNAETGEVIEREMNAKELAQYEADQLAFNQRQQNETVKISEKAALLTKLGITEDEAKLLFG